MMSHRSDIGRSVKEILRLVQAFRHSDLTGQALASGWVPGGEVIPTDFTEKVEYFTNKFGHGRKGETAKNNKGSTVDKRGGSDESKENVKVNDESKENISANAKAQEPSDESSAGSVPTVTNGPVKSKSNDKSSFKSGSGTPSDVSVARKESLDSMRGTIDKSNASLEKGKSSDKNK